ncbi:MAG: peptidylprolyl isomerase [Brumimicrobium sp.]
MALIGKIREKSWLLVAVIGIAMLAFIIGDLDSVFRGGANEDVYGIGTVNDEKVNEDEYKNFLQNARQNIYQSKQQQGQGEQVEFTEDDEKNAKSQAWNAAVSNNLMKKELETIGLIVDDFELENVLYGDNGFEPSSISTQFKDSVTGEFAPDQLRQTIRQMEESNDPEQIEQLKGTMDYVREMRLTEKYNALITAGVHTTTLEGKEEYNSQKTVKNVSYVYQSFTQVPQEAVSKVTDEEIKEFYEAHKDEEKYKQKASRKLSYFSVPVTPNKDDSTEVMKLLTKMKPKFKESKDDSMFVMSFSEVKEYRNDSSGIAKPEGSGQGLTYPLSIADEIESAEAGDVVGPYVDKDGLKISKVLRFVNEPTATVRHILLNAKSEAEVASTQKKADSIVSVIRSNNNFEEMVTKFSEDPGSKDKGGKYEDFAEGMMVPPFNDFSFEKPIGTLGTVKTDFGIHIIEVLDREESKRPILANVVRKVEPRKMAMDDVKTKVSDYIYQFDEVMREIESKEEKSAAFDSLVKEFGYTVRTANIEDAKPKVDGFGDAAEGRMLRLAFEEDVKPGMISSSPIRDNNRIILAMVTDVIEEGVPTFEAVKEKMRGEVRKEKQAQYLIDQMVGQDDLQALANQLNAKFETEGLTFSASNVAVGREPKIIGTAFSGLVDGQVSVPVKGNSGVFVLRLDNTVEAPETTDFSTEIEQLNSQKVTTVQNQHRSALLKSADVIDNRKLRSYGIR